VLANYHSAFLKYLDSQIPNDPPKGLYEPVEYIMQLGGKRIRPILALLSAEAVSGNYKDALAVSMAVETFHNFSLVHDDIMDEAPLRRTQPTVHDKWDINTGILSGDVMLVMAYQYLTNYPAPLSVALSMLFSETARKVCEGQQYDMEFPNQKDVTESEYLHMICYKTAVLLGCSLQMGAMVGGLSREESQVFYDFGIELGLAFQLQDDYLDAFGDPKTFGKQVGGDIIENKKTLLYLLAKEGANEAQKDQLNSLFHSQTQNTSDKIEIVKSLFVATKADQKIQERIAQYTQKALEKVNGFPISDEKKNEFRTFANALMERKL